jgi:hypothetical protein
MALAVAALALASCQTYTTPVEAPPHVVGPVAAPAPTTAPAAPAISSSNPYATTSTATWATAPTGAPSAPDPLDVRRLVLEKKAKLLTLEAQKLALEKSMRDLRAEITAEEKKLERLPKKKAATKAKAPTVTQQVSVGKAPQDDKALAQKLDAILKRLDRLENASARPRAPGAYAPPVTEAP